MRCISHHVAVNIHPNASSYKPHLIYFLNKNGGLISFTIQNHAKPFAHTPESVMTNFTTTLGSSVERIFTTLFPQTPECHGRQVVTFHNQRDFIFFRRYRYVFEQVAGSTEEQKVVGKARLQEIGPRFTLKLKWMQKGLWEPGSGEKEFELTPKMQKDRKKFFL